MSPWDWRRSSERNSSSCTRSVLPRPTTDRIFLCQLAWPPPPSQKEIDTYYAYARRVALGIVGDTVSEAKKVGTNVKTELPEGVSSVVETIISHAAKEHVDLIIVGTRGLGGFKKMLIGSVSSGVISHANCPVLVVR